MLLGLLRQYRAAEQRKALERQRLADLRTSGELLRQAEEIRALVARVEAAVLQGGRPELTAEQVARWKVWALSHADPVLAGQLLSHLHVTGLDD